MTLCRLFPLGFLLAFSAAAPLAGQTAVPFVGCASDGQVGPLPAPAGVAPKLQLSPAAAAALAFYKAENSPGVLAPRGWFCFSTYGSNGSVLYVSPAPLDTKQVFSDTWQGIAGPAVQVTTRIGDTSGRFDVARMIARVFPSHMAFARSVIAEGIEPASAFPRGPYKSDILTYKGKSLVEFETPAGAEGLGTHSFLLPGPATISGFAALVSEGLDDAAPTLVQVSLRLPKGASALVPIILAQAERESLKPQP